MNRCWAFRNKCRILRFGRHLRIPNSPFSAALSRHIGTPGLEVQQMLTRVRAEVVATTKSQQVPWSNSSLLGEVYLAEKP